MNLSPKSFADKPWLGRFEPVKIRLHVACHTQHACHTQVRGSMLVDRIFETSLLLLQWQSVSTY
jgi:hypothetical protein